MRKTALSIGFVYAALFLLAGGGGGARPAEGAVYTVGDSLKWTIMGSPNYTAWAASKNFQVGDTVLFVYNKQYHNVMLVTKEDYKACNASSPIATYTTGNDSYTLKHMGHYYFICGVPGHCEGGQRVDIGVPTMAFSAAPSSAPSSPSSAGVAAPSPMATPPGANAAAIARPAVALLSFALLLPVGFFMY